MLCTNGSVYKPLSATHGMEEKLDGIQTAVPDVYEIEYQTGTGAETSFHVGEVAGEFFFFFDCGEPLETPGGPSVQES